MNLTDKGYATLALAAALLLTAAWTGRADLAALMSLCFGALSADLLWALRRRQRGARLEVDAKAAPRPRRLRPATLRLTLRNPHGVIGAARLRLVCGGEPEVEAPELWIPAGAEAEVEVTLRFPQAGWAWVHGVELEIAGGLGLFVGYATRPLDVNFAVSPGPLALGLRAPGAPEARAASRLLRRAGDGLELRELRDYVPGDPLKTMAWGATARRQRPLVRVFEAERHRHVQLLLYIGAEARRGALGDTPLDRGIDLAAALIERLKDDRVGLTTFDDRVYSHLNPGAGHAHRRELMEHLFSVNHVVDEDLTEIDEAGVMARVGRFLEIHEDLSLRSVDGWRHPEALVDPVGEIFDAGRLNHAVRRRLASERARGLRRLAGRARPAEGLHAARRRLFCALWGIPLPYRLFGPPDGLDRGLAAALQENLGPRRAPVLVVLSDLGGLAPKGAGAKALALARRRYKRRVYFMGAPPPRR